jgi:hypothetical protein
MPLDGVVGSNMDPALVDAAVRVGSGSASHPRVIYAYVKHLWHTANKAEAVAQMRLIDGSTHARNASRVYDLTDYVAEHPGGDGILNHAGGDSSSGFRGEQHPAHVFDTIKQFLIGRLAEE